jgi:hypothetical protein
MARLGEGRGVYSVWAERSGSKRPLGRPRCRWEDNIKTDFRKIRINGSELDSAGSGYGPVAGFCEHGNEPSGSIGRRDILDKLSDSQLFK